MQPTLCRFFASYPPHEVVGLPSLSPVSVIVVVVGSDVLLLADLEDSLGGRIALPLSGLGAAAGGEYLLDKIYGR